MKNYLQHTRKCSVLREAGEKIGDYLLAGAELFITLEPVSCRGRHCSGAVRTRHFGACDPKYGAVGSLYNILADQRLNHQVEITEGILREECGEIIRRFFQQKRVKAELVRRSQGAQVP